MEETGTHEVEADEADDGDDEDDAVPEVDVAGPSQ
jgi:hypothetical protein